MSYIAYFEKKRKNSKGNGWTHCVLSKLAAADRTAFVQFVAQVLMKRLMIGAPDAYDLWERRAFTQGNRPLPADQERLLLAFVKLGYGPPSDPLHDDHAEGAVAETLWWLAMREIDFPGAGVIRVFGPDTRVTSPGGDGLVVHRDDATQEIFFRLWESKKCSGKKTVSSTISTAMTQVEEKADQYLAQYTSFAESENDADVKLLLGNLTQHWIAADKHASAGFAVATDKNPKTAFTAASTRFPGLAHPHGLDGLITTVPAFADLVEDIRERVWNAL